MPGRATAESAVPATPSPTIFSACFTSPPLSAVRATSRPPAAPSAAIDNAMASSPMIGILSRKLKPMATTCSTVAATLRKTSPSLWKKSLTPPPFFFFNAGSSTSPAAMSLMALIASGVVAACVAGSGGGSLPLVVDWAKNAVISEAPILPSSAVLVALLECPPFALSSMPYRSGSSSSFCAACLFASVAFGSSISFCRLLRVIAPLRKTSRFSSTVFSADASPAFK